MTKTGLFSGSFNPVHIGHLALANWLCEYEGLDEVWFLVTPQSPLKTQIEMIDGRRRLEMVERAVAGYPRFKASDFEFSLPLPSYTVDTLREIHSTFPDRIFHFIIGADNWAVFDKWKDSRTIIEKYPILVYPRPGYEVNIPEEHSGVRLVKAPLIEISSAFIRQAYSEGKDLRFFLPEGARDLFCK